MKIDKANETLSLAFLELITEDLKCIANRLSYVALNASDRRYQFLKIQI